jgi:NAD(P)-dependent dehydrogenase (short-subunit alcohol dehydrogenase family)
MPEATGSLTGKVALVTGGAQRIGRAIALVLANAGADVAITYLSSGREAEKTVADIQWTGRRAFAVRCEVRKADSVREAVGDVIGEFGGIDLLVNNAGAFESVQFDDITVEQWDRMFEINTRGPFLVTQAALHTLRARTGRVINIGSLGGLQPWATHAHYCSSKAALTMLSEVMAKALAPEIAVNCIAPGMIETSDEVSAMSQKFAARTPMKRNGTPDDVAAAVLFFATAPTFITGQVMGVDGGLDLV